MPISCQSLIHFYSHGDRELEGKSYASVQAQPDEITRDLQLPDHLGRARRRVEHPAANDRSKTSWLVCDSLGVGKRRGSVTRVELHHEAIERLAVESPSSLPASSETRLPA